MTESIVAEIEHLLKQARVGQVVLTRYSFLVGVNTAWLTRDDIRKKAYLLKLLRDAGEDPGWET